MTIDEIRKLSNDWRSTIKRCRVHAITQPDNRRCPLVSVGESKLCVWAAGLGKVITLEPSRVSRIEIDDPAVRLAEKYRAAVDA